MFISESVQIIFDVSFLRKNVSYFKSDISHSRQCSTTGVRKPVVCVHIKEPLLLIGKSSPCSGCSGFALSLSEWSFTNAI